MFSLYIFNLNFLRHIFRSISSSNQDMKINLFFKISQLILSSIFIEHFLIRFEINNINVAVLFTISKGILLYTCKTFAVQFKFF